MVKNILFDKIMAQQKFSFIFSHFSKSNFHKSLLKFQTFLEKLQFSFRKDCLILNHCNNSCPKLSYLKEFCLSGSSFLAPFFSSVPFPKLLALKLSMAKISYIYVYYQFGKKHAQERMSLVYVANVVSSRIADLKVKRAKKTKKRIDDKRNPRIASEERSNQSVSFLGSSSNSAHSAGNSNGASRLHSPFEKRHI